MKTPAPVMKKYPRVNKLAPAQPVSKIPPFNRSGAPGPEKDSAPLKNKGKTVAPRYNRKADKNYGEMA